MVIVASSLSLFFFLRDSTLQRANLSRVKGLVVFLYLSPQLAQRAIRPGLKGYTGRSSGSIFNLKTLRLAFFCLIFDFVQSCKINSYTSFYFLCRLLKVDTRWTQ